MYIRVNNHFAFFVVPYYDSSSLRLRSGRAKNVYPESAEGPLVGIDPKRYIDKPLFFWKYRSMAKTAKHNSSIDPIFL